MAVNLLLGDLLGMAAVPSLSAVERKGAEWVCQDEVLALVSELSYVWSYIVVVTENNGECPV
jgi:hypothetical protein